MAADSMEIPAIRGPRFRVSVLFVFAAALASCGQEAADIAVAFRLLH